MLNQPFFNRVFNPGDSDQLERIQSLPFNGILYCEVEEESPSLFLTLGHKGTEWDATGLRRLGLGTQRD